MRLVNRSGQDIEFRLSGGGNTLVAPDAPPTVPGTRRNGWAVLTEGQELDIDESFVAGRTLEVRVGEKKPTEVILEAIDDLIEVGRNMKVKILKTAGGVTRR